MKELEEQKKNVVVEEKMKEMKSRKVSDDVEIMECRNMDIEEVDLVQQLATEDNLKKLMDEEYNETEKKETMKLGFSEFQNVLDEHIQEMDIRKKNTKFDDDAALDTTSSNCKNKKSTGKKNKQESEFDNMLGQMMAGGMSDDEDETVGDTQLIKTDKRQGKAGLNILGDNYEMVTKFKNGTEYESQTFTSSAGGKLIINTIKKTSKKGKRKYKKEEDDKENVPEKKAIIPIKEEEFLEEGDEIMDVEEVEEIVENEYEEGEEYNPDDDQWSRDCDRASGHISEDEDEDDEEDESDDEDMDKIERQIKKDAKHPDYIDGMKVLKFEYTPQLAYEEDTALQNIMDPNRVEPESDDEDYALGTTNRIKVKGKIMLSAEAIHDKFVSDKKDLNGFNIVKEKKAEIRKKKIVLVDKYREPLEKDANKEIDEEL